jgi:hypothetical protein
MSLYLKSNNGFELLSSFKLNIITKVPLELSIFLNSLKRFSFVLNGEYFNISFNSVPCYKRKFENQV